MTQDVVLEQELARTIERSAGKHVLLLQDTSEIKNHYQTRAGTNLSLHPSLIVDRETGFPIGLLDCLMLERKGKQAKGEAKPRNTSVPFEHKQSKRWLNAMVRAQTLIDHGASSVTCVADREADIYECYAYCPQNVDFVQRADGRRRMGRDEGRLEQLAAALKPQGLMQLDLPSGPGRKARVCQLEICFTQVSMPRPARRSNQEELHALPREIKLDLVVARETNPPPGQSAAMWYLLTNKRVQTLEQAIDSVLIYRQRWTIEQVFRTMKTKGFDIEASQIQDDQPLKILALITLITAVRIMQMVKDRDGAANQPLTLAFEPEDAPLLRAFNEELEGKTLKQQNPYPPDTLAYAAWIMARLGGWNCYYGNPGPITLCRGYTEFNKTKARVGVIKKLEILSENV